MKKIACIFFLFVSIVGYAQAPQGINYQGVARNSSGAAMGNTNIAVQFKLYQGNPATGTLLYSEYHPSTLTDTFGLYSLVIGSTPGSGVGAFSSIPWSGGNIWVEVWIDPANGTTNFQLISQQQLMSVPYALYAETSGSGGSGSISGQPYNFPRVNNAGNGLKHSMIWESPSDSMSIGINNQNPLVDALVDMASPSTATSGKGLLIPRMTEAQRLAISVSALHHGLLVFQVNSPTVFSPQGFWYYDAVTGAWLVLAPAQAVWTLSGNAAGSSGFLGTLDNSDIVFKTGLGSAVERMRIYNSTKGGNVQFGNSTLGSHYIFPAAKGNAGDVLQMDPSGTNNLVWTPSASGSSQWTLNGHALYPTNFTMDSVGIGPTAQTPKAMLDVSANSGPAVFVTSYDTLNPAQKIETYNPVNGYPALDINSSATKGNAVNATANNAYALSGASNDASALWVLNNSSGSATIDAMNNGTHSVAYFHNSSVNGAGPILFADQSDPAGLSAQFQGGVGIKVTGSSSSAAILGMNLSGGDGIRGTTGGGGSGVIGENTSNGAGILGVSSGTGAAGVFQIIPQTNTANVLDVSHQGKGIVANFYNSLATNNSPVMKLSNVGSGATIDAGTTGTGSAANLIVNNPNTSSNALNVSTNGLAMTASFQSTNASSTFPSVLVGTQSNAPALKVVGSGPGISAIFNGGAVGVGTGTVNPTSGLDVKTSLGVSVHKYAATGTYTILPTDQNVVHIAGGTGNTSFVLPDATLCPGRILIFTFDGTITGGTLVVSGSGSQLINNAASISYSFVSGQGKPSAGVVSDGVGWQIIFKN